MEAILICMGILAGFVIGYLIQAQRTIRSTAEADSLRESLDRLRKEATAIQFELSETSIALAAEEQKTKHLEEDAKSRREEWDVLGH